MRDSLKSKLRSEESDNYADQWASQGGDFLYAIFLYDFDAFILYDHDGQGDS